MPTPQRSARCRQCRILSSYSLPCRLVLSLVIATRLPGRRPARAPSLALRTPDRGQPGSRSGRGRQLGSKTHRSPGVFRGRKWFRPRTTPAPENFAWHAPLVSGVRRKPASQTNPGRFRRARGCFKAYAAAPYLRSMGRPLDNGAAEPGWPNGHLGQPNAAAGRRRQTPLRLRPPPSSPF